MTIWHRSVKSVLLREMAEADAKMIEKYKEAIKKEDQVIRERV